MQLLAGIARGYRSLSENTLRVLFSVLAAASLAATAFVTVSSLQYLDAHSDECLWAEVPMGMGGWGVFVTEIVPGGRADQAGIRPGDRVLSIAGIDFGSAMGCSRKAQAILNITRTELPISYVVERNGQILDLTIKLRRVIRYYQLAIPALSLIWILIGLLVVVSRPKGQVQQLFFALGVTSLFGLTFDPLRPDLPGFVRGLVWGIMGVVFYILWVRFTSGFPVDQKTFRSPRNRSLLFLPALVLLVVTGVNIVLIEAFNVSLGDDYLKFLRILVFCVMLGYYAAGVWMLSRGYRQLPATGDRRPIKIILIGSILAGAVFMYMAYVNWTQTVSIVVLYPQYLLPFLLMLALPISFGYAIFRYQVMDFRPVVRATVTYGAMMVLLGGSYLGLAYLAGQAFGSLTSKELSLPFQLLLFVAFVLLFDPLKRWLQSWIENRFFPKRRDFTSRLTKYTEELAEAIGTRAVAGLVAGTLRSTLDLRGVWVLVESTDVEELTLVARDTDLPAVTVDDESFSRMLAALRHSHAPIRFDTTSGLIAEELKDSFAYAVGLHAQGRLIGLVLLGDTVSGEPLIGRQYAFINGVLTQGGSAMEVARLYEAELSRLKYVEQLNTARRIQECLLPRTMPSLPGISVGAISYPAQTVGGDYYDVIPLGSNRFMVMIADVSGKGLPASLYMAELHGMVRIASSAATTPSGILSVINRHLVDVIERGTFITASLLVFDTDRSTVSYARAGHTPIIRRLNGKIATDIPTGLPLGARKDLFERFLHEATVDYEPGETFILYSDGVSEAMNATREEFGEERLLEVIARDGSSSPDELCDEILSRIVEFRGGAEPNDDVTVVVIQIQGDAASRNGMEEIQSSVAAATG